MRKIVIQIVFLSALIGFSACENSPKEGTTHVEKKVETEQPTPEPDTLTESVEIPDTLKMEKSLAEEKHAPVQKQPVQKRVPDSTLPIPPDTAVAFAKIDSVRQTLPDDTTAAVETKNDSDFVNPTEVESYIEDEGEYIPDDVDLEKERLVKTQILNVLRPDYENKYDSTLSAVEKRISLNPDEVSEKIVVERWISPVNYRGYKFNRKKLMLYGVDKESPIKIFYYIDTYYFSLRNHVYDLQETTNNRAFNIVSDTLIEKHLLQYEPQL